MCQSNCAQQTATQQAPLHSTPPLEAKTSNMHNSFKAFSFCLSAQLSRLFVTYFLQRQLTSARQGPRPVLPVISKLSLTETQKIVLKNRKFSICTGPTAARPSLLSSMMTHHQAGRGAASASPWTPNGEGSEAEAADSAACSQMAEICASSRVSCLMSADATACSSAMRPRISARTRSFAPCRIPSTCTPQGWFSDLYPWHILLTGLIDVIAT